MTPPHSNDDGENSPATTVQKNTPPPSEQQHSNNQDEAPPSPAVNTPTSPSAPPIQQAPSAELPAAPSTQPVTLGASQAKKHTHSRHTSSHSPRRSDNTNKNPFSHPMDLSFGDNSPPSPHPHHRGRRSGSAGPIDLSVGPLSLNGAINAPYMTRSTVHGISSDYSREIDNWIRHHMYYPEEARRAGEEGPSSVHVVLDRFGKVKSVRLTEQSGSYSLDAATTSIFQGAHLPPIPPDMAGDHFDIDVTISYILIRQ
ncbi:energy transducer TonB [Swingsia samuiensis]|uniref:Energy transducer TonB n=2 Tax=Swingsia samuiensis TaxID=1293412 RepID=A0A4Y6UPL5_9PROT|nr:energy transducer TonB [Swingsia samuiensis]